MKQKLITFNNCGIKAAIKNKAKEHAIKIMGEDQFAKNKDAAKSVMDDFIAGAKYCWEFTHTD